MHSVDVLFYQTVIGAKMINLIISMYENTVFIAFLSFRRCIL